MLQANLPPTIHEELEQVVKRLYSVRERFGTSLDELGVHMEEPEQAHPVRGSENPRDVGLAALRTTITEINIQIANLEHEADRLLRARAELLGVGDNQWHETQVSVETGNVPPGRQIRPGDFGAHP